jgi:outer membrane protein assembly factor BamB
MGRTALFGILLCALACGSNGGGSGTITPPTDGGGTDAGNPDGGPDAGPLGGGDWGQYRHDPLGRSENPGVFEAAEVANLTPLWQRNLAEAAPLYVYTQAVAAEGIVVYTTAFSGQVVAVDAATGALRWPNGGRTLNSRIFTNCEDPKQPGFWASAAIANGVVYVASPDGHVYALRASDGTDVWPRARVADPSAAADGEFIQSSPAVSTRLGRLYIGVASSSGRGSGRICEVAGRIVAIDLATGAVQSQALVDPGKRGAALWSSVTIVEDENRIYATTGNREGPASATPYAQAFLALDPRTLQVLDHWQNPSEIEDIDFGSSPTPFDAGGMKLIAATSKDGNLYVLRRDALSQGPVWTYRIAEIDPNNPRVGVDPTLGWGSISTPAYAHGVLYAAGGKIDGKPGSVVAFNPVNGNIIGQKHYTPGYVLGPLALAGEILVVESTSLDNSESWLEVLNAKDLTLLRTLDHVQAATFAGPSIANGAIFWTDANGLTHNFGVPKYRR